MISTAKKSVIAYSIAVACIAIALQWFDYLYSVRRFSSEIYIAVIALSFTVLGVWVGKRLTGSRSGVDFRKNTAAMEYMGITEREFEVLELLAEGRSNQEIADRLHILPNTVKTHLGHLYEKMDVSRRTQAIRKAKSLQLIR